MSSVATFGLSALIGDAADEADNEETGPDSEEVDGEVAADASGVTDFDSTDFAGFANFFDFFFVDCLS
jgi:hypothetical protein